MPREARNLPIFLFERRIFLSFLRDLFYRILRDLARRFLFERLAFLEDLRVVTRPLRPPDLL